MDELADEELVIILVATYGEGEPADGARDFYEELMSDDSHDFADLKYCVFGLGNKTYEHYNQQGKAFDERLENLGATRIFELGLGDDDAGYGMPLTTKH